MSARIGAFSYMRFPAGFLKTAPIQHIYRRTPLPIRRISMRGHGSDNDRTVIIQDYIMCTVMKLTYSPCARLPTCHHGTVFGTVRLHS
jgi:hypothetical protein